MRRFISNPRRRDVAAPRRRSFTVGLFIGISSMLLYQVVPPPALPMPADEAAFVRALTVARLADQSAPNDLARLPLRAQRAAAICAVIPTLNLSAWTGRLTGAEPNMLPDLLGQTSVHLTITIAPHITFETPTSPLTNLPGDMLGVDAPPAVTAAHIALHQPVTFSGHLVPSSADCATVVAGGLRTPSFKLELSALTPGVK